MKRIGDGFVPVALKAILLANPPSDAEGALYAGLARSMPAPQGIGVADPATGRPLAWALGFDDPASIGAFLDRAATRLAADGPRPVERWMRYPSQKLPDAPAEAAPDAPPPVEHPGGARCAASFRARAGTLVARLVGRALDADGKPEKDTSRQELYVEDRFVIEPELQADLAGALSSAKDGDGVPVPGPLARALVAHAFLGQLDVRPLEGPRPGREEELRACELIARRDSESSARIEGRTHVVARAGPRGDGASFGDEVELAWEGRLDLAGGSISRLVLLARGRQKLRWEVPGEGEALARLPAGKPIDREANVRFGVIAEPVRGSEACASGEEETAASPDARGLRIRAKMERLQAAMQRRQAAGLDPAPVAILMQGFEPLVRRGRIDEAEKVLDRALAIVDANGAPSTDLDAVAKKLAVLEARVQELVKSGRREQAEAALDIALEALRAIDRVPRSK